MYRSIKDIEMDIIAKLKFWGREEEGPGLVAQGWLSVVTIDELTKRYIEYRKKLEAIREHCEQQLRVQDKVRETIIEEAGFVEYVNYHQFSIEALINVYMKILEILGGS